MKMTDTEGEKLPSCDGDDECWDIGLWGDGELVMSIPMFLEVESGEQYSSAGATQVNLRDILQEYLDDCNRLDGGEGLRGLAGMFRDFAFRYDAKAHEQGI